MRCWLAALGAGVLDSMINAMNVGGTYTVVAGFCILFDLALIYVLHNAKRSLVIVGQPPRTPHPNNSI